MTIDIERLKQDIKQEYLGAYFVGGFGAALIDSINIDRASPEEIVEIALKLGINIYNYEVEDSRCKRR